MNGQSQGEKRVGQPVSREAKRSSRRKPALLASLEVLQAISI